MFNPPLDTAVLCPSPVCCETSWVSLSGLFVRSRQGDLTWWPNDCLYRPIVQRLARHLMVHNTLGHLIGRVSTSKMVGRGTRL